MQRRGHERERPAGPALGFALIFTDFPLLYFDLQVRAQGEPANPGRSCRFWRPREFGRVVSRPAGAGA